MQNETRTGGRVDQPDPPALAVLSIDVEDWFQVENLRAVVPRDSWRARQLRVERNTDRMLELITDRSRDARCTFFVLGWVAARCPGLIRRIAEAGHEVASHGYGHELIDRLSRDAFRSDVARAKGLLEDITGDEVRGYRAPSFSITEWAPAILQEVGYRYDSSVFPSARHDRYGKLRGVGAESPVVELSPGFHEIGVSCLALGSFGIPWGGGGYFRILPYRVFRRGIRRVLRAGRPYVFYIHPWEIDPGQPRVDGIRRSYAFRHYVGLRRCEARFAALVSDFAWTTISDLLSRSRGRGGAGL